MEKFEIPEYKSFLTLEELDKKAFEAAEKYNFEIKEIGKSREDHPIYLIKAGDGNKKAFVWGFPHPNEPIGSLTVDWLINYFGSNPEKLKETGFTWYFVYTADPDGTELNEGWFKEITLKNYALEFFRQSPDRQIDWTFPVKYKDYEWDSPTPETRALMKIIDEIKPDLMYPLHNSGFGGAYFLMTEKFDDVYYDNIIKMTKGLGIPIDMGEPEEDFMVPIKKPFYYEFGFKDYYESIAKLGKNPKEILKHGDNSTTYLLEKNPGAIEILAEVPYFIDEAVSDYSDSGMTRREAWLKMIERNDKIKDFYLELIPRIIEKLDENDPFYPIVSHILDNYKKAGNEMKKHVESSEEFEKIATKSEVFSCEVESRFYSMIYLAQLRRAALRAELDEVAKKIESKVIEDADFIDKNSNWKTIPIKDMVGFQVAFLFESLEFLKKDR